MKKLALIVLLLMLPAVVYAVEPFTFVHISDTHITASGHFLDNLKNIAAEVNALNPKPAFVVATGDLTEMGFTEEYDKYREAISAFDMPVYSVPGNHEVKWSNWGKLGPKKFMGQTPFYSFDHGGIHFVGIDSSMWLEHHGFIDGSELTWLKNDLDKAGRTTPVVIFYHHCPGFLTNEQQLLGMLRPYNVRLALVGHGHSWSTWKRNGILFQECKGAMNDQGGFRILEVADDEIRSYKKLIGKDREADGSVSLKPIAQSVVLLKPRPNQRFEGKVHVRAMVLGSMDKVEYRVDGPYEPITPDADGICDITVDWTGTPGWHIVSIKATDKDGVEWYDSAPICVNAGVKEAWRLKVSGAVQRPVRAYGDRLYFGTWGGDVYCVDARTGRQVWRTNVGSDVISEVAVAGNTAYLGATGYQVVALDANTGAKKWEYTTDGPIQASPVAGGGKVFVGSGDKTFYALDAKTGKLAWKREMTHMTQELPIYMNGTVYYGSWDDNFYALRAADGKPAWITRTSESVYTSPSNSNPATDGKRIVFGINTIKDKGDVWCLDAATGKEVWTARSKGKSVCSFNSPCIAGGRMYIADLNGYVSCLNMADGKQVWLSQTGDIAYDDSPVYADGKVYIGGLNGGLYCLDAKTGNKEWTYSTGDGYNFASPTVWRDLIIAASTDGTVTAVRK